MIHVAVVDDHALVRAGLEKVLEREDDMQIVGAYADGDAFFKGLPRLDRLDVVLLDVTMPLVGGLEALERLGMRREPPATLFLSMHTDAPTVARARSLGARGFVSKASDDAIVVQAVRTIAWGGTFFPDGFEEEGDDRSGGSGPGLDVLSDQERHVFILLHRGLSQKEIARDLDVSAKTVSTYKRRLMAKLGVDNIVDLIHAGDDLGVNRDA